MTDAPPYRTTLSGTGYTFPDLKTLLALGRRTESPGPRGIFAPAGGDTALRERIAALRGAGEQVVQCLPGQVGDARAMGCTRELRRQDGQWVVVDLEK